MASNGHLESQRAAPRQVAAYFLGQIPQPADRRQEQRRSGGEHAPMQSSSEMTAIFLVGSTSMQSLPGKSVSARGRRSGCTDPCARRDTTFCTPGDT